MSLDNQISEINKLLTERGKEVFSGGSPNLHDLEKKIADFLNHLKTLPPEAAKDYSPIFNIWTSELTRMSEKLTRTKAEVQKDFDKSQTQGRAANAYMNAKQFE